MYRNQLKELFKELYLSKRISDDTHLFTTLESQFKDLEQEKMSDFSELEDSDPSELEDSDPNEQKYIQVKWSKIKDIVCLNDEYL